VPQLSGTSLGGVLTSVNVKPALLMLALVSCGMPSDHQVRSDFLALHPSAAIIDVGPGEGDSDHAYWCVRYRERPDTALREQVWLYQRQSGNRFAVIHRDSSMTRGRPCAAAA